MEISNARYNMKQLRALGWLLLVLLIGSVNGVAQSVSEIRVIKESASSDKVRANRVRQRLVCDL